LALDFIDVDEEKKILYLSSEMTALEISRRLLSNLMPKNIMDFRKGRFDKGDREALDSIATIVGDHWNLNIKKVFDMEDIRKYIQKYNPEIVFMDYLQNLDRKKAQTDYQKVTGNIKDLQAITLGKEISTFVVSQLSRVKNLVRKPRLSDLRDSGRIEEVSNIVLFVYWEERMQQKVEMREGGESPEKLEIIIAKNRDGTIGGFKLDFYPEYCQAKERERKEYEY
jgi:replicative DNA helicase